MFGFKFLENFNFPYLAQSIREFWQRWHISLSTWFRDYLYIPMGGKPCLGDPDLFKSAHRFFSVRPVARGELDLCGCGVFTMEFSWCWNGRGLASGKVRFSGRAGMFMPFW
ncbi:MAG: MBOAT family O-acyltransferase [Limisphaerales bacterium]